jgi:hypothetical protein
MPRSAFCASSDGGYVYTIGSARDRSICNADSYRNGLNPRPKCLLGVLVDSRHAIEERATLAYIIQQLRSKRPRLICLTGRLHQSDRSRRLEGHTSVHRPRQAPVVLGYRVNESFGGSDSCLLTLSYPRVLSYNRNARTDNPMSVVACVRACVSFHSQSVVGWASGNIRSGTYTVTSGLRCIAAVAAPKISGH